MNKNILVMGGAGFIGSNLCESLLNRGNRVMCFDNFSTSSEDNIKDLRQNKNFAFVKGDANTADLDKVFKDDKFDVVFHYAATVGVKRTLENPLFVLRDIEGIKNILELSRKNDVKKIVYSSSSEVYGNPVEVPEKEDGVLNPKLPYAIVKLVGENYLKAYYEKYGLKSCSLRFFNVYGPKQIATAYGFVVGIFIDQVSQNKRPTIFGDGKQTRDFVYIEDNINASIKAMDNDKVDGKSINIGTGKEISILELANTIIKLSRKNLKPQFLEPRPNDIMHRCPDVTKMKKLLDYNPKYSLEEGLKKTIEWYETKKI